MADSRVPEVVVEEEDESNEQFVDAEEKGFLSSTAVQQDALKSTSSAGRLSHKFWISAAINTVSTAAIVFTNKHIFTHPSLRHAQVSFAAFHFAITFLLLYTLSRPRIALFEPKRVDVLAIMPLALGMIFNVVLPNASLAYSSIQFYQIVRVLVTPCVCALNFVVLRQATPRLAVATLVPVCVGVGLMSWFDTKKDPSSPSSSRSRKGGYGQETSLLGVVFAFAGVFATSVYTVWIKKFHAALDCTSMQLLLNQAPVSVVLMLYIIPFADDVTIWGDVEGETGWWILLSGGLACLITTTQFVIIQEAGPVSSTVVGHFKTCLVILLSWMFKGGSFSTGSLFGIAMALGGIISYSAVMHQQAK